MMSNDQADVCSENVQSCKTVFMLRLLCESHPPTVSSVGEQGSNYDHMVNSSGNCKTCLLPHGWLALIVSVLSGQFTTLSAVLEEGLCL